MSIPDVHLDATAAAEKGLWIGQRGVRPSQAVLSSDVCICICTRFTVELITRQIGVVAAVDVVIGQRIAEVNWRRRYDCTGGQ